MSIPRWTLPACLVSALLGAGRSGAAAGEGTPADKPDKPARPVKPATEAVRIPHVKVDREKGYVDLDARVCLTEGLLELIVTTKGGKEHESCFAILAKPRHVMVALLLIGLKPGSPARVVGTPEDYRYLDPTGDPISISVIYEEKGKRVERPITDFVFNRRTEEPMKKVDFVFAGSAIVKYDGKSHFTADMDGTVVSLVSFGSELVSYPTGASKSNDMLEWEVHSEAMPEDATSVVIRMRPGKRAAEKVDRKASNGEDGKTSKGDAPPPLLPAEETEGAGR